MSTLETPRTTTTANRTVIVVTALREAVELLPGLLNTHSLCGRRTVPDLSSPSMRLRLSRRMTVKEVSTTRGPPLRVLVIAPSLDRIGGQAVQAARLLVALRGEPSLAPAFLRSDSRLPAHLRWLQSLRYVRTLVNLAAYVSALVARVPQTDVVHVFAASFWSFVLTSTPAIAIGKFLRKRVIVNYHSGEAAEHLAQWRSAVWTFRRADAIVVQSTYLQTVFARHGLPTTVIANHIDVDALPFRDRRPLRPLFVTCRALEPTYDVATVLRACSLIQRRFPEAALAVVGEGSQRESLELLADQLQLRNTTFLGGVKPDEMGPIYDSADVMVNASTIDSMPVSILEAFACGLPVITTDAGGIPCIVIHEKTGLLVPKHDAKAMADAAIRLLDDDELASRLMSAARSACAAYTWSATGRDWLELYSERDPQCVR